MGGSKLARNLLTSLLLGFALAPFAASAQSDAPTVVPVEQASYHVPAFSNEYVTVLNVFIPPQRASGYHRHSLDSIGVLIARHRADGPSARRRGHRDGAARARLGELHGLRARTGRAQRHGDGRHAVPQHRRRAHVPDAGPVHAGAARPRLHADPRQRARARSGGSCSSRARRRAAITQAAPGVRVVVDGGELVESAAGRPDRNKAPRSGEFFWQDAGATRAVRNVGTTRIELVELELK